MVNAATVATPGVPPSSPVLATSVMPDGSDPAVTAKEYGPAPPDAETVCEYGTPGLPPGRTLGLSTIGRSLSRIVTVATPRPIAGKTLELRARVNCSLP